MQPPDEHHAPDRVLIQMLMTLRRVSPEGYDRAIAAAAEPLPHLDCPGCPPCWAARLASTALPPDPFTDTEEPCTMAKTKTATEAPTRPTSPCQRCGLAVEVPKGWDPGRPAWVTCPQHRLYAETPLRAEALAALGIEDDPDNLAVQVVFMGRWWLADHSPQHRKVIRDEGHDRAYGFRGQLNPVTPRNSGSTAPWGHLDPRDVRRRIKRARHDLALAATARPNTAGKACAGCGVARAVEWVDLGAVRVNEMIMCGPCASDYERSGGDAESFARRLLARVLTAEGARPVRASMTLDCYGFKPYSAATGADPKGYPEPFGYLDPDLLDAVRQSFWSRHPQHAPAEMRVRLERVARARALVGPRPSGPAPALVLPGAPS